MGYLIITMGNSFVANYRTASLHRVIHPVEFLSYRLIVRIIYP